MIFATRILQDLLLQNCYTYNPDYQHPTVGSYIFTHKTEQTFENPVDKHKHTFYTYPYTRKSLSASQVLAAPPQIDFFITYTQIHKRKDSDMNLKRRMRLILLYAI